MATFSGLMLNRVGTYTITATPTAAAFYNPVAEPAVTTAPSPSRRPRPRQDRVEHHRDGHGGPERHEHRRRINVTYPGAIYNGPTAAVTFANPPTGGTLATGIATVTGGVVTAITDTGVKSIAGTTTGGTGVLSLNPPLVTIAPPTGTTNPVQATAIATVNASGVVTGIIVTNPGNGYVAIPTVSIAQPVIGTPATGAVAAITTPGAGYTAGARSSRSAG